MRLKYAASLLLLGWMGPGPLGSPLRAQTEDAPPPIVTQSPEQLQQLVAPIALYPDELVAQVLAAATYPAQVVEADRWLQQNPSLKGQDLAMAVDQQPWDASVKGLTQFPSVLANMDKNLSWTSSLGEAYNDQPQQVMDAVQTMRKRAQGAGNLKSTDQEKVKTKGNTIVIEPAAPDVVYVPEYDPWLIYGDPLAVWPGWYYYPGLYLAGPGFGFGLGFDIGFFGGFGWGWHHWGFDWHHRDLVFDHHRYFSNSRTFINHNSFANRGFDRGVNRGSFGNRNGFADRGGFAGREGSAGRDGLAGRDGFANRGGGPSAFGGFNHGGITADHSFRGQGSFGGARGGFSGGGGFHGGGFGGGGGFHGGGGRR